LLDFGANGVVAGRRGNRGRDGVLQDVYPCAGDDAWVAVTVQDETQAAAVRALLPEPDRAAADLDDAVRRFLAGCKDEEAVDLLVGAGVPAGVVRRPTTVAANAHVVERGFYERHEHPTLGALGYPRLPTGFASWTGPVFSGPAPTLGQHNAEVLGAVGVDDAQLAALERDGVIGTRPAGL
jgi:crotonobetainyl-CoA:carnitine CoA-transferase CaiB-like acyl-CoA transferase